MTLPSILDRALQVFTLFLGAFLGASLAFAQGRASDRRRFVREQLDRFYGPVLATRLRLRALGELRVSIDEAADKGWREKVVPRVEAQARRNPEIDEHRASDEAYAPFGRLIETNNDRARESVKYYEFIVQAFVQNLPLVDLDTRDYFTVVIEFAELWKRYLADEIPRPALKYLEITENRLEPFYAHVQERHDVLRTRLQIRTWWERLLPGDV